MEPFELDAGKTAWMLAAASLVLLMTPALAPRTRMAHLTAPNFLEALDLGPIGSGGVDCGVKKRSPDETARRLGLTESLRRPQ